MADTKYNIMLTDARILWQNAENAFQHLKNAEITLDDKKKIPVFFYNSGHSEKYTDKNAYSNEEDDDYSIMVGTTIELSSHSGALSAEGYSGICKSLYDNLQNYIKSFAGNSRQSNMNNTNVEVTLCHDDTMKEGQFSKNSQVMTDDINTILNDDNKYKKMESGQLGKTYEEVGQTCVSLHTKMPNLFKEGDDESNKPNFIMLRTTYGIV